MRAALGRDNSCPASSGSADSGEGIAFGWPFTYSAGSWYPSFITSIFASTESSPWERSP